MCPPLIIGWPLATGMSHFPIKKDKGLVNTGPLYNRLALQYMCPFNFYCLCNILNIDLQRTKVKIVARGISLYCCLDNFKWQRLKPCSDYATI